MKNYLFATFFAVLCVTGFTQDSTKSGSSVSMNFSSVPIQTISGTDTGFQNALSISPVLDLRTKAGWGVSYSPGIVTSGAKSGIYMHTLSAGYEKYGGKNLDMVLSYSHFFFTGKTSVPYSPLSNEVFFYLNYTHSWLSPVISASFGFGKDTTGAASITTHDIGLAVGVNHNFSWEGKGIFSSIELTPSILLNAGTNENFSFLSVSKYLSHSHQFYKYVKKEGGSKGSGRRNNTSNNSTPSLTISNLQFSLEGGLDFGSFSLRPSGNLFLPVSSGTDNSLYGYGEISLQFHL